MIKPISERPPEEARKISKKGGIASGAARRRKKLMKKLLNELAVMEVPPGQIRDYLEEMGIDPTNEAAIALSIILEAISGNVTAFDMYMKYTGQDESRKVKLKKAKAETEYSHNAAVGVNRLIDALTRSAEEDWKNWKE